MHERNIYGLGRSLPLYFPVQRKLVKIEFFHSESTPRKSNKSSKMTPFIFLLISISYIIFSSCTPTPPTILSPKTIHYNDINSSSRKSEIFDAVLEGSYDVKIRPPGINGSGPVAIFLSLFVRSIENLDDNRMHYTIQLTFRQGWIDPRVNYTHLVDTSQVKYLQLLLEARIWMPDIFFSNEKSSSIHKLMRPNIFTRIYPEGRILQSYRITLVLSCPMNLRYYPLDTQLCPIRLSSYGWTVDDLALHWRQDETDRVVIAKELNLPQFQLNGHAASRCRSITTAGEYSCIQLHFEFERRFGFYLIQIYVPCIMLVVVSWVSFWLGPTAVEARISLGVTTILTIVTQTYGINQSVPPASYIKAIDVWTAVCQFLVFSAMVQFSYVNYLARMQWRQAYKEQRNKNRKNGKDAEEMSGGEDDEVNDKGIEDKMRRQGEFRGKRVDNISKIGFPLGFAMFNVVYWGIYANEPHSGMTMTRY